LDDTNGKSNDSTEAADEATTVLVERIPGQQDRMVVDMTTYPTVLEVARRAGVSQQAVRQWQRKGKLTALEDSEGTTRFHPVEVDRFLMQRGDVTDVIGDMEGPRTENAVTASIYLRPREKLDDYMMRILDRVDRQNERLMAHNERMEKILESSFERREAEEAARAERKLVTETLAAETKMKETLVVNVATGVAKVGELISKLKPGGAGKPTIEFLEELPLETLLTMYAMNDMFSEEAQAKILRVLQQKQREERTATEAKKKAAAEAQKETTAPSSAPSDTAATAAESSE